MEKCYFRIVLKQIRYKIIQENCRVKHSENYFYFEVTWHCIASASFPKFSPQDLKLILKHDSKCRVGICDLCLFVLNSYKKLPIHNNMRNQKML